MRLSVYKLAPLALLLATIATPQTVRSSLGGTLTAPQGAPLPGVAVQVQQLETGRTHQVTTDANGEFLLPVLRPGEYRIEIAHTGYRRHIQTIELQVNQEVRVDIPLLAGQPADTVEVTATRDLLKTDNASLGAVIETHQIGALPLDGRNFLELSLLVPGTVPAAEGSAGSVRGDFAFNVNGGREDGNSFLLDGVYNGDPKLNTFGVNAAVDALREFEVVTSAYDASFGRNAGGQINAVLRSGSNQIHGTVYEFIRNSTLDARNFFAPAGEADPRYQRNQFGFSLGGPIVRNKTFLFGDYEGLRSREGITRVTNVPTALERIGDFSQSGLPFIIDPFTQMPFPGNKIPAQQLHPIGAAIASLYPLPNRNTPGQNYVSSPIQRDRNDRFDVRLDHELGQASDLTIRYSYNNRLLFEPFTGRNFASIPGYGDEVPRVGQNLMLGETHAFSPALLNEFRASFNRVDSQVLQQGRTTNTNALLGLPSPWTRDRDNGLTFISLPGYSSIGDEYNNPQSGVTNTYQVIDHLTWARGRNTTKVGFEFRRLQQNAFRDVQARGLINFFGVLGSPLVDLLQGLPVVTGYASVDNPQYLRNWSYSAFVNETWRMHPRVTINAGLRYEYNSPGVDRYDRANVFDPASNQLVPVGQNGFPRGAYNPDRNNFAPRIGFSWLTCETTVVRGGYGLYFDQSSLAPSEGLYFSPPYFNLNLFIASEQFPLFLHDPFPANYPFPTPPSASAFQRDLRTPYMQHWNLNVQRQLGGSRLFEIGYVGSKGTKLYSARDINQPAPSAAAFNPRPLLQFQDINILESRASSIYHSLQARFQQRLHHGVSILTAYTYGKSIDDASGFFTSTGDPNFPQDSRNVSAERARSSFDVRQRFTLAYTWDLPLGRGLLLGGWQTAGIWSFQTGRPFTVMLNQDLDNSGTGRSNLGFGNNDRPNVVGNPVLDNPTPDRWFNTAAFVIPQRGTFGNAGRNILDGPGMQSINVSILKHFPITEGKTLQFRAEAFNLFNHANFNLPDLYVGNPTIGRVSSAGPPRHIQFGLKMLF